MTTGEEDFHTKVVCGISRHECYKSLGCAPLMEVDKLDIDRVCIDRPADFGLGLGARGKGLYIDTSDKARNLGAVL